MIMIESERITENVKAWRTDVVARIINGLGLERVWRKLKSRARPFDLS